MSLPRGVHAICALPGEAATLKGSGITVTVCGIGAQRARTAAEEALENGARSILCWGVAGGLAPELASGALFLPRYVADEHGRRWPSDLSCATGGLLSVAAPVTCAEARYELRRTTGCLAADMESAAVADVCAARGIPFWSIRAIADPAQASLPSWLPGLLGQDGRPRLARLAGCLVRERDATAALIRAARQYHSALATLRRTSSQLPTLVEDVA